MSKRPLVLWLIGLAAAGDLWSVPRNGGDARRLTAHPGADVSGLLAGWKDHHLCRRDDGSRAVYVVQSSGGIPKCLTWNHQEQDRPVAWTRDGKRILFRADWSAKPPGAGAPGFPMFPA